MTHHNPDVHIRGVHYRPYEEDARELANNTMAQFEVAQDGTVTLSADVLAELLVGNSFESFLTGMARGMRVPQKADVFLQGIEEGRAIERRMRYGYSD